MDIPGAFSNLFQSCGDYCDAAYQNSVAAVLRMKQLRNDPEFFQKICQVAYASLQLIMLNSGASYLNRTANAFYLTAGMHDFYRFIRYPRQWFFPVDAASINEFAVLDDLTDFVYQQIGPEDASAPTSIAEIAEAFEMGEDEAALGVHEDKAELRKLLKACLTAQLDKMSEKNDAYRNVGELMKLIEKRLHKFKEDDFNEYAFSTISFEDLQGVDLTQLNENNEDYNVAKWSHNVPLLERIMNWDWMLTDLGCVALFSREWGWLNKEKWAQLDSWVLGFVCTGFSLKLVEAVRKLQDENLTSQDRDEAKRNAITAGAELVYFVAVYLNHIGKIQVNVAYLHLLAIAAKSIGLINIATQPRHQYFEEA